MGDIHRYRGLSAAPAAAGGGRGGAAADSKMLHVHGKTLNGGLGVGSSPLGGGRAERRSRLHARGLAGRPLGQRIERVSHAAQRLRRCRERRQGKVRRRRHLGRVRRHVWRAERCGRAAAAEDRRGVVRGARQQHGILADRGQRRARRRQPPSRHGCRRWLLTDAAREPSSARVCQRARRAAGRGRGRAGRCRSHGWGRRAERAEGQQGKGAVRRSGEERYAVGT